MISPGRIESVSTESLIGSMTALLPQANFRKILDPCCGSGKLISTVSNWVESEETVGVDILADVIDSSASKYPEIGFIHADSTEELDLPRDFDLVVGALPLGMRCEKRHLTPDIFTTNTSDAILFRSLLRLNPGGIGMFLAAHNLLVGKSSKNLIKNLSSEGINPIGLFYVGNPLGERSGIPGVIIIFQREKVGLSVVGKAPLGSEKFLPGLRDMVYATGTEVEGYRRSVFENISSFTSDGEPIFTDNESNIESLKFRLNDMGLDIYEFDDVVIRYSHTKPPNYDRLPHEDNSIYLPKASGVTQVSQDDLSPKLKKYYQLVLDPLIAKDVYVMDNMNSEIGKKIREICSTGQMIPQIGKSGLKKMLFPLHSIEEQEEWADASLEIKQKQDELEELKQLLNERKNISKILETLESDGSKKSLEKLLLSNESTSLEFKGSMWTTYIPISYDLVEPQNKKSLELQDGIVKTIAAFLNSDGGDLLIGVKDKPRSVTNESAGVIGIEGDFRWLAPKHRDTEGYTHALIQLLNDAFGDESTVKLYLDISFHSREDGTICRIHVKPLPRVMNGEVWVKTKTMGDEEFFYRVSDTTTHASAKSANRYIRHHFETSE